MRDQQFKQIVYEQIGDMLSALAEPRRLEMLELLCQCERNVESVAELLGAGVTTVSHHLQVLKRAGLATDRKDGRRVYYRSTNLALTMWNVISRAASSELTEVRRAVEDLFAGDPDGLETPERPEATEATHEVVDYGELQKRIGAGEAVLIDVRPVEEYAAGHVPGAMSVSLEKLEEKVKELPQDKPIYAYCRGRYCVLSHEAARLLSQRGYTVSPLREGIAEWKAEQLTLEIGEKTGR